MSNKQPKRKSNNNGLMNKLSHEQWLIITLSSTVFLILGLISALAWQLQWSRLAIATLTFFLAYPIIWFAWRSYHFWRQSIMQLTTYTQVIREGESNLRFKSQHKDNLLRELQQEIFSLAQTNQQKNQQHQSLENVLSHILDSWPIPVCLFDENHQLSYRNLAMKEKIQQPMIIGTKAQELGFTLENDVLTHNIFNQQWQCQSISYFYQQKQCHIFSALDISAPLHQQQSVTQQNIIRVLTHELRNSLTPMASMADTLLSNEGSTQHHNKHANRYSTQNNNLSVSKPAFDDQQVRLVLTRIKQRSERLLSFIEQYSQLSHLPKPKSVWFDINELIDEASAMMTDKCSVTLQGNAQCFGDSQQVAQILINLFKNAYEACDEGHCHLTLNIYHQQKMQVIEVIDNGPGFANLDNVLTPFYTTKTHGSGIGLSLCAEISRNHGGELSVANTTNTSESGDITEQSQSKTTHAKIVMTWPSHR